MPTQVATENAGSPFLQSPAHDGQPSDGDSLLASAPESSVEDQILERFIARLASREDVSPAGLHAIRQLVESRAAIQKDSVLRAVTEAESRFAEMTEQRPMAEEAAMAPGGADRIEED